MIEIKEETLLRSIEKAYIEYRQAKQTKNHIRTYKIYGWFSALERIADLYAPQLREEIARLRSFYAIEEEIDDLDTPTFLRRFTP